MTALGKKSGFTILELLIAIAITLALTAAMLSITTGTLSIWRRVQGNFSASSQAKLVLDLLERDLQSAVRRADANRWLSVEMPNAGFPGWVEEADPAAITKPVSAISLNAVPSAVGEGIAQARFGLTGVWLRFFAPDNSGQPVAISYRVMRTATDSALNDPPRNPRHYFLFRSQTQPAQTLTTGYDIIATPYTTTFARPTLDDVLADNVVDFGVWLYVRDSAPATGLTRIYPTAANDVTRYLGVGNGTAAVGNRFPDVADVMVRILTEEGVQLLENLETGRAALRPPGYANNDEWWWGIIEAHSQVFVRRIKLTGGLR